MINLVDDRKVTDALAQWRGRKVWPTEFGSADLRGFSRELMNRSIFSARTTNAEYLNEVAATIDDLLANKINMATARLRLMQRLAELGYDPEKGFPQDMAHVPPAERGSLQDLSSKRRLDLMLETNFRMAVNYGRMVAGLQPYERREYPAWELVRLYRREVPRGTPDSHSVGWQRRWREAAAAVAWEGVWQPAEASESRMIAMKTSPIWKALGDGAGGHDDALGNPYPPFAFQSGMGWRAVDRKTWDGLKDARDEGEESKVRSPKSKVEQPAEVPSFAPGVESARKVYAKLTPDLREQLQREMEALGL